MRVAPAMHTFAELFDHLAIECGEIVGPAARNDSTIDHYFFINPFCPGID
jgi:hypothetical protein